MEENICTRNPKADAPVETMPLNSIPVTANKPNMINSKLNIGLASIIKDISSPPNKGYKKVVGANNNGIANNQVTLILSLIIFHKMGITDSRFFEPMKLLTIVFAPEAKPQVGIERIKYRILPKFVISRALPPIFSISAKKMYQLPNPTIACTTIGMEIEATFFIS